MEYLANKLTDYIIEKGIITEDMTGIYKYGFQCFLEFSVSTLCSIIIALFFGMLPECLFFFLLFIPMRSFGGGLLNGANSFLTMDGSGAGFQIFNGETYGCLFMILPLGGFLTLGCLIALMQYVLRRSAEKKELKEKEAAE